MDTKQYTQQLNHCLIYVDTKWRQRQYKCEASLPLSGQWGKSRLFVPQTKSVIYLIST